MFDEKIKKALKITGIIFLGIFLLSFFNAFFGKNKPGNYLRGNSEMMNFSEPAQKGLSDQSVSSMMPSFKSSTREMAVDSVGGSAGVMMEEQASPEIGKKVIKTGDINMKVTDADEASAEIKVVAKSNGGDVFSVYLYEAPKGYKSGTIVVKVPNANFEKAFSDLKKVASHVTSESVSGQDVTEQYTDLEIQIRNKKAEEERFLKILEQAVKIEDVLAVTKEVSRTRREVESLEGRMKLLNSQVDMSSISMQISEDVSLPVGEGWRPWEVVKNSFKELVSNLQGFVDNFINFLIVVLPTLLVYGILIFIVYKAGRKIYFKFFKKQ